MKINNECTVSPRGLIRNVERSLDWLNPLDLYGVSLIRLMDDLPKPTDRSPHWHRDLKKRYVYLNGLYIGKYKNEPAHINLYIRNLYRGIPSLLQSTPLLTLVIVETLAHEVGHHLIVTRGYIFQPTEIFKHQEVVEEFCDRYAFSIVKKMMAKRHYRFFRWILKNLAGWYYSFGSLDWKDKKYEKAAERFLTSFHLDNSREGALYWYRRAKATGNAEQAPAADSVERSGH